MDQCLPVFLSTEDTINPHQITNSICRHAAPNLWGTSTRLHCFLQTLIIVLLSSPSVNKLPAATDKYFKCWLISPDQLLPCFCTTVPLFLCKVESLGLVSMSEVWIFGHNSSLKTTSGPTSPDSRWVYLVHLVSAGSELMALLDIMCLSSAALSFLGRPLCLQFSTSPVSLCFFKRSWTSHVETSVCSEIFAWQRLCWCRVTTLCLVAVLSLVLVSDLWHQTVFHSLTLVAEFVCSSPSLKPPTAVSVSVDDCVSTYIWNWSSSAPVWFKLVDHTPDYNPTNLTWLCKWTQKNWSCFEVTTNTDLI